MSQTIVCQVLDYYTDKTTSMAVKISRQADKIKGLDTEVERLRAELEQVRDERDCLVKDLHAYQTVRRLMEDRMERGEQLLERYYALHHDQGVYNAGEPEAYQKIPFEPAITVTIEAGKFLHPSEQKEAACVE